MRSIKKIMIVSLIILGLCIHTDSFADNDEYGKKAYEFVRYLNDNLPARINDPKSGNPQRLLETRQWLVGQMESMGYSEPEYFYGTGIDCEYASVGFRKNGKSAKTLVIGAHYDCVNTKGAEDNGTGVGLLLELADRFKDVETNLSIEFCFWDGEETLGMAGSYRYLELLDQTQHERYQNIFAYINLDSVGSGDNMYVYGGKYGEDGILYQSWGYNMAMTLADELGVELHEMPAGIEKYVPPTRSDASDQYYFYQRDIPYMYFEANAWLREDGSVGNPEKPYNYNSVLPCFEDTNGRIIHTKYDDLDVLEGLVPGRIQEHLTGFSRVISELIRRMDESAPETYAHYVSEASILERRAAEAAAASESESISLSEAEAQQTETQSESASEVVEETSEAPESTESIVQVTESDTAEEITDTQPSSEEEDPRAANRPKRIGMWIYIGGCSVVAAVLIFMSYAFSRIRR